MSAGNTIITQTYVSPSGPLIVGSIGGELCLCDWRGRKDRSVVEIRIRRVLSAELQEGQSKTVEQAVKELDEYFAGVRKVFSVPLRLAGTEFQLRVWRELRQLPYGQTMTYAELARRIGKPGGVRAVAGAVGANALSVFVPCHRIIGADGTLTGYAGGLEAKRFLLELERRVVTPQ